MHEFQVYVLFTRVPVGTTRLGSFGIRDPTRYGAEEKYPRVISAVLLILTRGSLYITRQCNNNSRIVHNTSVVYVPAIYVSLLYN